MTAGKESIVITGLTKTFSTGWPWKRIPALLGLDLAVREGEIFGYLGPNGAGKTTTLKLLVGLLRPSSGTVTVGGYPPGHPRARALVGFLPENPYFYEYLTGREFLTLAARLGRDPHAALKRVDPLLERVGLAAAATLPLRKYSKGMLQRAGLAQALVSDPPLLILDEPMSGLDPIGRREVRDIILGLKREGKTILFSSHILADVELICDRVAFIFGGRLRKTEPMADLLARETGTVEIKAQGLAAAVEERIASGAVEIIRGPEGTVFVAGSRAAAGPLIDAVRAAGGTIVAVAPRRRSLEDEFMQLVGQGS